jgi:hypothetical protein
VLTVSLPTTPGEKTRKIGPLQPACHVVPRWYLRKAAQAVFLEKRGKWALNNYEGQRHHMESLSR